MLYLLLVAHLLGDYLFQWDALARWKYRSVWGVVAHGGIVTVTTLICAALVDPAWWPYALLIGVLHTVIDVVRAIILHPQSPTSAWLLLLLDQALHLGIIVGLVLWTAAPHQPDFSPLFSLLSDSRLLPFMIGYLILLHPAWVLLRFTARGLWGESVPPLGQGEKYAPMVERVLMATLAVLGLFYLIPLTLLPRRLLPVRVQSNGMLVMLHLTAHWGETLLSVTLATLVGVILRVISVF